MQVGADLERKGGDAAAGHSGMVNLRASGAADGAVSGPFLAW
jgi:hypothetical protein